MARHLQVGQYADYHNQYEYQIGQDVILIETYEHGRANYCFLLAERGFMRSNTGFFDICARLNNRRYILH